MTTELNEEIVIERLNLDAIPPEKDPSNRETGGAIYLIIGPSGSGKSEIIKSILWAKKSIIPVVVAISETEDVNKCYSKIIPDLFVFNKNDPEIIEKIIARQKVACEHLKNPMLALVLDDCMNKTSNMNEDIHTALFKTSRHYQMMTLISCQSTFDLKPSNREQAAGFFILRSDNSANRKKIYNNYASIIPNEQLFNALMDTLTSDYCCMFIKNRNRGQNWFDNVFWFKRFDNIPDNWNATSKDVQAYSNDRLNTNFDPFHNLLGHKTIKKIF
jgi:energy-coupling factor transporter ATP-binding protein EcfA2